MHTSMSPTSWTRDSLLKWQEDVASQSAVMSGNYEHQPTGPARSLERGELQRSYVSNDGANRPSRVYMYDNNYGALLSEKRQTAPSSSHYIQPENNPSLSRDGREDHHLKLLSELKNMSPVPKFHQQNLNSSAGPAAVVRDKLNYTIAISKSTDGPFQSENMRQRTPPSARRAASAGRSVTFASSEDYYEIGGGHSKNKFVNETASPRLRQENARISGEPLNTMAKGRHHDGSLTGGASRYQSLIDAIRHDVVVMEEGRDVRARRTQESGMTISREQSLPRFDDRPHTRPAISGDGLGGEGIDLEKAEDEAQQETIDGQRRVGVRPTVGAGLREVSRRFGGGPDARERARAWALDAARHEVERHAIQKARNVYERHAVELGGRASGAVAAAGSSSLNPAAWGAGGGEAGNSFSSSIATSSPAGLPFAIDSSVYFSSPSELREAQARKNASRRLAHRVDVVGGMPVPIRERRARSSSSAAGGRPRGRASSSISSGDEFKWARGKAFTMTPLRPIRDGRFETPGPGAYVIPSEFQGRF